jgi:hypothetical protein
LGVYFYLKNNQTDVSDIGWLPVCSMVFYIIVYSFGKTILIVFVLSGCSGNVNIIKDVRYRPHNILFKGTNQAYTYFRNVYVTLAGPSGRAV